MTKSARQYVFEGMELLPTALAPYVEKRLEGIGLRWQDSVSTAIQSLKLNQNGEFEWDQLSLFQAMDRKWNEAFRSYHSRTDRAIVIELIEVRNRLSHNDKFSYGDAERSLDSMRRLMGAINCEQEANELDNLRHSVLDIVNSNRRHSAKRISKKPESSLALAAGIRSWHDVSEPQEDVAKGTIARAEFMADLGMVINGRASSEYSDPVEFFSRTYLTEGLSTLLINAYQRLTGSGGDPVVELQTNFGGGKTHSLLALYHMAGDKPLHDLPGLDQLLHGRETRNFTGKINRAVFHGTARSPLQTLKKNLSDGSELEIRTLWGNIGFQLGGEEGFRMIEGHDKRGIAPGSELLSQLFADYEPAILLIDEWVAYLRQIYKTSDLPSGTFDSNLTFAQSLTEAVNASRSTFLVASLPESEIEVGGEGGAEALARLKQTFGRVEASWRPASREESYEIVRRRLFKGIEGNARTHRDNTINAFMKLYKSHPNDFPSVKVGQDYKTKLQRAYPIHPELFDQLYSTWGSLETFQRTRGVLRLMAQVIHELWVDLDRSAMIMPGSVPASAQCVIPELRRYLTVNWSSIIEKDVDGDDSVPYKIDIENPNLLKRSATKRVARTVFLGTAPTDDGKNIGLDSREINLGVVQPGESPLIFGDALRRLANEALNVHGEQGHYRYSTRHNLNRVADRYSEEVEEDTLGGQIDKALATEINSLVDRDCFSAVQTAPEGSGAIPDDNNGVRIVVLGISHSHSAKNSKAEREVRRILENTGKTPRVYANTLIFLAADERQLRLLKESVRKRIAWSRIKAEKDRLDLTQSQSASVDEKVHDAIETVRARIKDAWQYLIYPSQETPDTKIELIVRQIAGQENVLVSAGNRLVDDEGIFVRLGSVRLNQALRKNGIWRDNRHLYLKDLWEHMNRFVYLPRLKSKDVLMEAVSSAVSQTIPREFAYAQAWDEEEKKYIGLVIEGEANASVVIDSESVIVESQTAEENRPKRIVPLPPDSSPPDPLPPDPLPPGKTRFQGAVDISAELPGQAFGKIMDGIVNQLKHLEAGKAAITIRVEIDAKSDGGFTENEARNLKENASTLGFLESKIS